MKTALIVPAYRPTQDMIPMLQRFVQDPDFLPVVVNDGSGPEYDAIFAQVPEGCALLVHPQNKGKGMALKTAMRHVLEHLPQCDIAVTADADGQHRDEDIRAVVDSARAHMGELVLGSRSFDGDVPFRSRFGNGLTRHVFTLASGVKVRDTQTGLRAFDRALMQRFLDIPGERYEYEINMLLYTAHAGTNIREETIATVYIDDNSASSFNPLKDSIKIYRCIFRFIWQTKSMLRFFVSSLLATAVDFLLIHLLHSITNLFDLRISQIIARIVSGGVNFYTNKRMVYKSKGDWKAELAKYIPLWLLNLAIEVLVLKPLNDSMKGHLFIAYVVMKVALIILNFFVQGKLVYVRRKPDQEKKQTKV